MTCIVIAYEEDLHADAIVGSLSEITDVIRIDPYSGNEEIDFCSSTPEVAFINGEPLIFHKVTGVCCRLALESLEVDSESPIEKYSFREHVGALTGFLLNISAKRWINFPWHESRAEGKVFPLLKAASLGIKVPRFWVSNRHKTLSAVTSSNDGLVVKPITDAPIAIQNGQYTDSPYNTEFYAPYTANLEHNSINYSALDGSPFLIQDKIQSDIEIRVCIVDNAVFATQSEKTEANVDVRLTERKNEKPFILPAHLEARLKLLTKALFLRCACYDLLRCKSDEEYYLLDVNPSGNWLWQEIIHGLPIAKEFSKALVKI